MKKYLQLLSLIGFTYSVNAQFPYFNPLQNDNEIVKISNSNNDIRTNQSVNINGDINGTGAIATKGVLLTNTINQKNGFVLKDLEFETAHGFNIDFEYYQWGNGTSQYGFGDGLAMVLYDAKQKNPEMGADGAGLGYTSTYRSGVWTNGFTDGYMAFGIDNYGNFANRMSTNGESRNGLTNKPTSGTELSTWNGKKSTFVIRGSVYDNNLNGNSTINGDKNRRYGYPVLRGVSTNEKYGSITINNQTLDYKVLSLRTNNDGTHSYNVNTQFGNFDIRGGQYTDNYKGTGYRKTNIHFLKGQRKFYKTESDYKNRNSFADRAVYLVTVKIETENNTYTILDNTGFSSDGSLNYTYYEDTGRNFSSTTVTNTYDGNNKRLTSTKAPEKLSMAFTGTTGGAMQNQLLRNVNITLPFSPEVKSYSNNSICPDAPQSKIVYPLTDAVGYQNDKYIVHIVGETDTPAGWVTQDIDQGDKGINYIDPSSFSFMVLDPVTNKYVKNTTPHELDIYDNTNQLIGKYHFVYKDQNGNSLSAAQSYVYYQPISNKPLTGQTHTVRYTVKNKAPEGGTNQINQEVYRSSIGIIEYNFASTLCGKSHIITNKNVTTTL